MKPTILAVAVALLLAPVAAAARPHGGGGGGGFHLFSGHRSAPRTAYAGIMGARSHGGHVHDVRSETSNRPGLTTGPRVH